MEVIGKQDEADLSFLSNNKQQAHVNHLQDGRDKIDFRREFSEVNSRFGKQLSYMLEFNPHFRKDAESLLKSSLFDSVRDPEMEKPAPCKIENPLTDSFDYITLKSGVYSQADYRSLVQS